MSILEAFSLVFVALGAAAVLRFVWLDSLRFGNANSASTPVPLKASAPRQANLKLDATRASAENSRLPKAA